MAEITTYFPEAEPDTDTKQAPAPATPDLLVCRPDLGPGAHTLVTGDRLKPRADGSVQVPRGLVPAAILDRSPGEVIGHPADVACPLDDDADPAPAPAKGRR